MQQKHYPVFPLLRGSNRKEKRRMMVEFKRFALKTAVIEELFAEWINNKPWRNLTYDDLYKTYLGLYIDTCENIQNNLKPKYIVMNPQYFKEMYSTEFKFNESGEMAHFLHEWIRQRLGYRT